MTQPLVSCVMPTCNRRQFVPAAIACYQAQTYANRELVILDDGTDPIADLVPADDPTIRYVRLEERLSTGAKRNASCRAARGEFIAHWDDDDWSAPDRLKVQVTTLQETGADICGLRALYFYEPATDRAWRYQYPAKDRPWVAGGTMCYRRALWEAQPFAEIRQGEDTKFVWSAPRLRVAAVDRLDLYVATIHAGNTSAKQTDGPWWVAVPGQQVRSILGAANGPAIPPGPPGVGQVTVAIPHHGPGEYLRAAVLSILGQTYPNLNCVVVFDGDRRGADLIADIDDPRLVRHVLGGNHGRYFADQVVLEATSAPYFLVQDSDDWSEPTRVERLLAAMGRSAADVCLSEVVHHDHRSGHEVVSHHGWPRLHDPIGPTLVHRAGHQGMYRSEFLRSIGGWYAGHRIGFDTSMLNNLMLAGGHVACVPEPLYHRNIHNDSLSTSAATGANSAERRRVAGELRRLHQRIFIATGGGRAADSTSRVREVVLEARGTGAAAILAEEAAALAELLVDARGSGPRPIRSHDGDPSVQEAERFLMRDRLPDVHALLARYAASNPSWSISAMGAMELHRRVTVTRPRRILDVGSGLSTVVEAIAAAGYGGRVTSLEHDQQHAQHTLEMLRAAGVDDIAEVIVAPLVATSHECGTGPWYSGQPDGTFDFIVVDGPPLGTGGRIAAFPALSEHRGVNWEFWLFDANRPDEQHCLTAWAEHFEFDLSLEQVDPTGVAVLRDRTHAAAAAPVLDRLGISILTGGRPDLLERTLRSVASRWPEQVQAAHVVALVNGQDSQSREVLERPGWVGRILTYDRDALTIGTATSFIIAALAGHPDVKYVMHLEDDWEALTVDRDALVRAAEFLGDPGVGQVRLRHRSESSLGNHMVTGSRIGWRQGSDHRRGLAHFTFNPSLITTEMAERVYPAADERDAQRRFLNTGLDVVHLDPGAFCHIGERSRRLALGRRS